MACGLRRIILNRSFQLSGLSVRVHRTFVITIFKKIVQTGDQCLGRTGSENTERFGIVFAYSTNEGVTDATNLLIGVFNAAKAQVTPESDQINQLLKTVMMFLDFFEHSFKGKAFRRIG